MKTYDDMRREIVKFIDASGICAYDLMRIGKDLCCCKTCRHYVQHYLADGAPVDWGHCKKHSQLKAVRPSGASCGNWSFEE